MTKCCTKRPNCDNQPTCTKESNIFMLTLMFTTFNIFFIIFRILLIKREEMFYIPAGKLNHLWWYTKFIIFLELQLLALYCWYYITLETIRGIRKLLLKLKYYILQLVAKRKTNPFMKWLKLIILDWFLYKVYCILAIMLYVGMILALVLGYLLVVFLFGPYLLGYYKMDYSK